jgi:hypothetical protein
VRCPRSPRPAALLPFGSSNGFFFTSAAPRWSHYSSSLLELLAEARGPAGRHAIRHGPLFCLAGRHGLASTVLANRAGWSHRTSYTVFGLAVAFKLKTVPSPWPPHMDFSAYLSDVLGRKWPLLAVQPRRPCALGSLARQISQRLNPAKAKSCRSTSLSGSNSKRGH